MNPILEQICRIGIIPVIAIDDAKKAVPLADPWWREGCLRQR